MTEMPSSGSACLEKEERKASVETENGQVLSDLTGTIDSACTPHTLSSTFRPNKTILIPLLNPWKIRCAQATKCPCLRAREASRPSARSVDKTIVMRLFPLEGRVRLRAQSRGDTCAGHSACPKLSGACRGPGPVPAPPYKVRPCLPCPVPCVLCSRDALQ